MKRLLASVAVLMLCVSCTTFHVTQIDESPGERRISLDIKGTAWFSSSTHIAKLKALQSDKVQSFGTDNFTQQGATNTIAALQNIVRILELVRPVP